jgi:hypothetical protein
MILEFSVKSGKHSTRTLSLVQIWVRFFFKLVKKYISIGGVGWGCAKIPLLSDFLRKKVEKLAIFLGEKRENIVK